METIYLKNGAEDIQGNQLNTRMEYTIIATGQTHSVINNGYRDIHVNNKYKKNLTRNELGFFCIFWVK